MKIKVQQQPEPTVAARAEPALVLPVMPCCVAQLVPSMLSVLKAIEPDVLFSGYDGSTPDTSSRLMSTLNRLGGQQVVSAVKWAKSLPGEASCTLRKQEVGGDITEENLFQNKSSELQRSKVALSIVCSH